MSDSSFWLIRFENQVLTQINHESGNVFPFGRAADFGLTEHALLVGQWQGHNCYAVDFKILEKARSRVAGDLILNLRQAFTW